MTAYTANTDGVDSSAYSQWLNRVYGRIQVSVITSVVVKTFLGLETETETWTK